MSHSFLIIIQYIQNTSINCSLEKAIRVTPGAGIICRSTARSASRTYNSLHDETPAPAWTQR